MFYICKAILLNIVSSSILDMAKDSVCNMNID